eukprot:gene7676-603_t
MEGPVLKKFAINIGYWYMCLCKTWETSQGHGYDQWFLAIAHGIHMEVGVVFGARAATTGIDWAQTQTGAYTQADRIFTHRRANTRETFRNGIHQTQHCTHSTPPLIPVRTVAFFNSNTSTPCHRFLFMLSQKPDPARATLDRREHIPVLY